MRRPTKSSAAIPWFAAAVREEELEPREPFFVPFSWGLPDGIDSSPWWGDPNVQGWVIPRRPARVCLLSERDTSSHARALGATASRTLGRLRASRER